MSTSDRPISTEPHSRESSMLGCEHDTEAARRGNYGCTQLIRYRIPGFRGPAFLHENRSQWASLLMKHAVKMMVLAVFQGSAWAARGPPGGRQGASRGPRGLENWGRFLVHPYARRTSSRDPYHQVGEVPRKCQIDNCFL